MAETLVNGTGSGCFPLEIGSDNRAQVRAVAESLQHATAHEEQNAYQVIGEADLASGTVVPLHISNGSVSSDIIVTYIRHQSIDAANGTAFPNVSNYFRLNFGRTYASGGTLATIVNTNSGSVKTSEAVVYEDNPTLTGTTVLSLDKWYTKAEGDMNTFNKEGAVILRPGQTMELAYIGDHTAGIIYSRLSFIVVET